MKSEVERLFSRAAGMLLLMLLTMTAQTAWAIKTETHTYDMTLSGTTISIKEGATTTDTWLATTTDNGHYWTTGEAHSLGNGMTIGNNAVVHCGLSFFTIMNENTKFTFRTNNNHTVITDVTFKKDDADVQAVSTSGAGATYTVTLPLGAKFTGFVVTCGEITGQDGNIAWVLEKDNSGNYTRLTIDGTGDGKMNDYKRTTVNDIPVTNAPWGSDITGLKIGPATRSIGENAFCGCQQLSSVSAHVGVMYYNSIGNNAFSYTALTSIKIPDQVTTIGDNAFAECTKLAKIDGANGVTSVGSNVFYNTHWLANLPANELTYVGHVAYRFKGTANNVRIADGTTQIADQCFNNTVITSVVIPASVTCIGNSAFSESGLDRGYFLGASVQDLDRTAFLNCQTILIVPADAYEDYSMWPIDENDGTWERGYTVTCDPGVTATGANNGPLVQKNEEVTLSGTVPAGYLLDVYTVTKNGTDPAETVDVSTAGTFLMPASDVTINATFDVIPWEGTGAVDAPYIIEYPSQLILLAARVNSGTTYSGNYFQLGADITFDPDIENNFTPIGKIVKTDSYPFMGTFKGNGYKITGIHINDATLDYAGLFGAISGATLDGVVVEDITITAREYTGGLVGYVTGTSDITSNISNCRADGYVSGKGNTGGFVGSIFGTSTVTVTNCVARVDVRSAANKYGGFIGWANDENATISNCWCSGAVWGKSGNIGAFVGYSQKGTFENCSVYPYGPGPRYFSGSNENMVGNVLTGTDYAAMTNGWPAVKKHSHGLIPIATADDLRAINNNLDGCYVLVNDIDLHGQTIEPIGQTIITINDGKTTLTDTPFTGEFYGQGHKISRYTVETTNAYAGLFGNIAGGRVSGVLAEGGIVSRTGDVNTTVGVGGFAGVIQSKSMVDDCSFTGTVSNKAAGKKGGFGGFVGRTDDLPAILRCCADVDMDNKSTQPNTGGFVGEHGHGYIVDAYAVGQVSAYIHWSTDPDLNKDRYVGGFAGFVGLAAHVINAWCEASIDTNTGNDVEGHYIGAFVGQAAGSGLITNSYYDIQANGNELLAAGIDGKTSTDYTGITGLDDMDVRSNFQGFDFDVIWMMGKYYPVFRRGQQHVTFDPAGGTCAIESKDYAIGDDYDGVNTDNDGLPVPVRTGYSFLGWFDDFGIQVTNRSTVTFDTNRTLHAQWLFLWNGTGSEGDPYIIESPSQLDLLASQVNDGTYYENTYFELANDIKYTHKAANEEGADTENNYIAIGYDNNPFKGHFDGQNHVISGIRINFDMDYQGLFGEIGSGAEVKNVILTDAQITGAVCTGGIAGRNNGGTISGCFVENDVTIGYASDNVTSHGGIVGNNLGGLVSGCASKATVNGRTSNINGSENYGGVAGLNNGGTIEDCLYLGSIVEGKQSVGAIVGCNYSGSTVRNCYYTTSGFEGKTGNGATFTFSNTNNNDPAIGSINGTTENVRLAPQDTKDNSDFISLLATRNAALTAVERAPVLNTTVDMTLTGRTLFKDNAWNTLCLPFDVVIEGSPLAGDNVQAMTLNAATSGQSGSTLTLNFDHAPATIPAGTPFIIKWDSGDNLTNPVFTGVTVSKATPTDVVFDGGTFKGTYSPIVWESENKSILLVGGNNLYYPQPNGGQNPRINACRAYFQLADGNNASEFVLNFGDETTGVNEVIEVNASLEVNDNSWYTLSGTRLDKQPTEKGLYIHNGKKIVIK